VRAVSVSLDGSRAQTHDGVRGIAGHFQMTIAGSPCSTAQPPRSARTRIIERSVFAAKHRQRSSIQQIFGDMCGSAHGPYLRTMSVRSSAAKPQSGVSARSSRASADASAPTILLGQAPSDRGQRRPRRPGCLIPSHPVSPVSPPGRAKPWCCYTSCYSARHAKGPLPTGKGP
jgi:hypothetical protein